VNGYTRDDVATALRGLEEKFGRVVFPGFHKEYSAGAHRNVLAYEKDAPVKSNLTALEKYIVGATSSLVQPAFFYDIFTACRHVKIVQLLNRAIDVLQAAKTNGLTERLDRLRVANDYDDFDAVFFELLVACRYSQLSFVSGVEFLPENPALKTPDIRMRQHGREVFCECKKMDRSTDFAIATKRSAEAVLNEVLAKLRDARISARLEVVFLTAPSGVAASALFQGATESLRSGKTATEESFQVRAKRLSRYTSDTYKLYPSPDFFWGRYGYRLRSEWCGLVHNIEAKFKAPRRDLCGKGEPSWLDSISWDCAAKWKLGDSELLGKFRRFGFNTTYKALQQIEGRSGDSTAHIWIESEHHLSGREATFHDFLDRLRVNQRDVFGWLVFNEILFETSPMGIFDLIEHAHFIRGPSAISRSPPLTLLVGESVEKAEIVSFGRGVQLPDIDDGH